MTTVEEITAQIETIRSNPEYVRLLTSSRDKNAAATFGKMELQIKALQLRLTELKKREDLKLAQTPQIAKRSSALVPQERRRETSVVMTPAKPVPDPEPVREPLFAGGKRRNGAGLRPPTSHKSLPGSGEAPTQVVAVPHEVIEPPVDISMPYAKSATPAIVPTKPLPPTAAKVEQLRDDATAGAVRSKNAGRVAAPGPTSGAEPQRSVTKPKGLPQLSVVPVVSASQPSQINQPSSIKQTGVARGNGLVAKVNNKITQTDRSEPEDVTVDKDAGDEEIDERDVESGGLLYEIGDNIVHDLSDLREDGDMMGDDDLDLVEDITPIPTLKSAPAKVTKAEPIKGSPAKKSAARKGPAVRRPIEA